MTDPAPIRASRVWPRLLTLAGLAAALTACTPRADAPGPTSASPASSPSSSASSPASTGSSTPPPSGTSGGCPDRLELPIQEGPEPEPVCLAVHGTLHLASATSPWLPWGDVRSSDDTILRCATTPVADGAVTATCTALRPGTVTLIASTSRKPGGPVGPPQFQWQLTVTVR
jgi:hypothetical protein